jgi:hypothetical protein
MRSDESLQKTEDSTDDERSLLNNAGTAKAKIVSRNANNIAERPIRASASTTFDSLRE